jgi:membrane protease YdiL (CAAX protease family)
MLRDRPLYALVLALTPAAVIFSELFRGSRSTHPWHLLGVLGFAWLLFAVAWYCWKEYRKASGAGVPAREPTAGTEACPTASPAHALYALGLFIFLSLAAHPLLFALLTGGWGIPLRLNMDGDLLYYSLSLLLWIAAFLLLPRAPDRSTFCHLRLRVRPVDALIFAIFGSLTWLVLTQYLLKQGGHHPPMEIFGVNRHADPLVYYAIGALFTLVNALSEELWFRGLLLGALRGLLPLWPAVLLQALIFGLSHWFGTPQGVYGLVLAGLFGGALGWWTAVRGSLWPALAVHLLADWLIFAYTNG